MQKITPIAPAREKEVIMARYKMEKTKKDCIYKYVDGCGSIKYAYRYKYYDKLKHRREKTKQDFDTLKDAERALIEVQAAILNSQESFVESENITIASWIETWIDVKKDSWRPGTVEVYEGRLENHIRPLIGKYKLAQLTNMVMQRNLVNKLFQNGFSRTTVKNITRTVISALNYAVTERVIKENFVTSLDFGTEEKKKDNFYDEEQLKELLLASKKYDPTTYYTAILTLALSGIRKGELCGLRWSDIDFKKCTITIDRARVRKKVGPPKSKNGYRTINVNPILINQLKKYKTWCIEKKWSKNMTLENDDYVFIDRYHLTEIGPGYVNDALEEILKETELPRITPHGLRHTFTSILIANKIPTITVAKIIGDHPATVEAVYAHSLARVEEETVQLFNEILL
ncbi:tyrosine-type recombinase/integrase [Metasolibacillus meyeri]|uniref:tyrosine-type recombinase/integrase n=1 Tax=Metasolibacillus meyeri TaxID=1071052 RepID=UPI000D317CD7|nr:site-specific integrase [Metasolibacillus meyeri]